MDVRIDLLWGDKERPNRGPKPGLTLDRIVEVAIAIADGTDLNAVTMGRVAEECGVTTMALYRYVPSKEALIDAMVQAAMGSPPHVDQSEWRASLERWARADRVIFERHPWMLDLSTCTPVGPNWLAWLEAGLLALSNTGLTPQEMVAVVILVDGHVRNVAQIARGGVLQDPRGARSPEEWRNCFTCVLERVADDARYPTLSAAVASGAFEAEGDEFEFGLQRVLDGVAAFIRERKAT